MSAEARHLLCTRLVFQHPSQQADLLNTEITQTNLIALLLDASEDTPLEMTAVKSDHRDDRYLGVHCHYNGFCADCWPLASKTPGDYLDANDARFKAWLEKVAQSQYLYELGLAGTADTPENRLAAGPTVFEDSGADHVHLGAE